MKLAVAGVFVGVCLLSGCAAYQASVYDRSAFRSYRTACLEELSEDEFNITPLVTDGVASMGLAVIPVPPTPTGQTPEGARGDVTVKIEYKGGWDLTRYLKSLSVSFIDSSTGRVVATGSYRSRLGLHGTDSAVSEVFDQLRDKLDGQ